MTNRIKIIYMMSKNVFKASLRSKVMYGLLFLSLLFMSMAHLPFVMKELQDFKGESPLTMAIQMGFFFVNIFMVLIVVSVSLGMLQNQLEPEKMILILAKPVRRWEMLFGITLGLIWMLFLNWLVITGGLWLTIFIHTKQLNFNIFFGMGIILLLAILFLSLIIMIYTFIPSTLSGILAFLILLASFGTTGSVRLIQWISYPFLIKVARGIITCLPKIIPLWGISMKTLGILSVDINSLSPIMHTFILIILFNCVAVWRFERN